MFSRHAWVAASIIAIISSTYPQPLIAEGLYKPPLHEDSWRRAMIWSKTYPGIAVEVILGTESKITPGTIEAVLGKEFAEAGVDDVVFFYRQNDVPSTVLVYYYSGATDGPFILNEARAEAKKSASQYLFQQGNPALAYEYPD